MGQHRTGRIQLALWGGTIGFFVMAFRAVAFAAPEAPNLTEFAAWLIAGLFLGVVALGYSLAQYFSRPRPE